MSDAEILVSTGNLEEALPTLLTAKNPTARASGRAFANGWPVAMNEWLKDELERDPTAAIMAVMHMQVSFLASIASQVMEADTGPRALRELYVRIINRDLERAAREIRAATAQELDR